MKLKLQLNTRNTKQQWNNLVVNGIVIMGNMENFFDTHNIVVAAWHS